MNLGNSQEIGFPSVGLEISHRLNDWSKRDPIYALMVELHPDPSAGQ
jgi:hypothetical protein